MAVQRQSIDWSKLAQMTIVFGHQSVGGNILSGVQTIAAANEVALGIREHRGPPESPGITHFKIGRNEDPLSKIADFTAVMKSGGAEGTDVALMKLCYIDFAESTDARKLAMAYIAGLDRLAREYPATAFVAVTTPLAAVQTGPKAWVKRLMGRLPAQYRENAKRAEFNALIREHYAAKGRLFDLARIESETGERSNTIQVDGREVESLDPSLTYDGGHLNQRGEALVATAFLHYISSELAR